MIVFSTLLMAQNGLIKLSEDLEIKKISDNIFLHISYYDLENYKNIPANGLIVRENDKVFIIDTPWTNDETKLLLTWLEDSLKVLIEGVIVTHWHKDCMGGLEEIQKQKIRSYAYQKTIDIAPTENKPIPDIGFRDSLKLHLDGRELTCIYLGAGHTVDNCLVWIPREKILFAGCPVKALGWKSLGYTGDADLNAWSATLQKMLIAFPDCQAIVPGHGDIGGQDLIHHTLDLLSKHHSVNKK